jgi:tetratricopeptide (TPR) repeat protein
VRREDTVRLDTHYLVRRIEVRGLKQGWLADQVGVARKTVSRWTTGKVKRLGRDSATRLAEVLACSLDELTVRDEADVLATKAEQTAAAKLIQQQDLLQLLSPSDNWQLAESLIKASLQPDLPARDLGRLYNLLAIAAWRQGKYGEGSRHASRALELGERTGDRTVVHGAVYNQAVVDSLTGDHTAALAAYERLLAEPEYFDTKRDHAKVLSNVGDAYQSARRFAASERAQRESIRLFDELRLDLNLSIAWVSLGYLLTEAGRYDEASDAFARGEEHARAAQYVRGVDCAPIYAADPLSLRGETAAARRLVLDALPSLTKHEVYDLGCHAIAARVLRRAGDLDGARAQVTEGLRRSGPFPEPRAQILLEQARLALAHGDATGEEAAREEANRAFRQAGLELRARSTPVGEHGPEA